MHRRGTFWVGRNGPDALSMASSFVACLLLIVAMIVGGVVSNVLWLLALACLVCSYFRIFSRQKNRRRQKNLYCFFKCPQCGTVLRVPKGKGHIRITCKSCSHIFERNS